MSNDFGKYEVIAEIGRGGMGIIYKARDAQLDRMVAIKQLVLANIEKDKQEEFRERFRREAILAAQLNHQNLVSIYDVSISSENCYYVMELLEGHSLRKELEISPEGKLTAQELYPVLQQIAEGLAYTHNMNLVHRDIKPDNIFILPNGKVKLTDFGIARSAEPDNSNLTKPGVMLGTLSYVSPEQLQDARNVDLRADIFSLGVVVYEALSGQLPFAGDGLTSTLMAIVARDAKPLSEVSNSISHEMSSVVAKAMRKSATERYGSVMEFLKEYEKALSLSAPQTSKVRATAYQTSSVPTYTPGIPVAPRKGISEQNTLSEQLGKPWLKTEVDTLSQSQSKLFVKAISTIGKPGDGKGCFLEPAVICCLHGIVVVADAATRLVQIFTKDGRCIGQLTNNPSAKGSKTGGGLFSKPSALAMDSTKCIYAADSSDNFIRVFDLQGKFIKEFRTAAGKEQGLHGLAYDASGLLYASDPENGCIHVLQASLGTWLRKFGSRGTQDGQFKLPSSIAIDKLGRIFIVDYTTAKISIFNKAGLFQRSFGGKGTGNGLFNVPRGIAIDKNDRVYVADSLNHRIQVFSTDGDYLYSFGGQGKETGKFIGPSDLSIDPDNNCLYVADRGNARVQVFQLLT
jgi:serine/threonine protein kinase